MRDHRTGAPAPQEEAEIVRTARDLAYDDFLAALLAPRAARGDLLTLAAAFGELARIPLQVSDATMGEIRLQWWRDALAANVRTGHPVADALNDLGQRLAAPPGAGSSLSLAGALAPVIDARAAELYAEPFADAAAFEAYVSAPERAHFTLRAAVLGVPPADLPIDAAARTLGLVRSCVRLPLLFAKGRYPIAAARLGKPEEGIDEAALRRVMTGVVAEAAAAWSALRPEMRRMRRPGRTVFVPLALSGPYLRVLQDVGHDLLRQVAELSPLERSMRLWVAARLGRF